MSEDYLKPLNVNEVAAWYYRLAAMFAEKRVEGTVSLSSIFLKQWLDNRKPGSTFNFTPPNYLQNCQPVKTVQHYHRKVFLTEEKARIGKSEKWAGVLPRLQGSGRYARWTRAAPLTMQYESLCDIAPGVVDILRIQSSGSDAERDLFASLRGFQLKSEIIINGKMKDQKFCHITFQQWKCKVIDTYDWNYSEHLTVPNPDFGSKEANAVRPKDRELKVYHINAKRLEDAGLAAPYKIESYKWPVNESTLLSAAIVDTSRILN